VHETKSRSVFKAVSFRVIEVAVTTIGLVILQNPVEIAFGFALMAEGLCLALTYLAERIWNRINYGRHVYRGKKCEQCKKRL